MKKIMALVGALTALSMAPLQALAVDVEDEMALQMYTLRNVGTPAEQFEMAHKAGFKHVELVGTHELDAKELKALLEKNQLTTTSSHVQLKALEDDL